MKLSLLFVFLFTLSLSTAHAGGGEAPTITACQNNKMIVVSLLGHFDWIHEGEEIKMSFDKRLGLLSKQFSVIKKTEGSLHLKGEVESESVQLTYLNNDLGTSNVLVDAEFLIEREGEIKTVEAECFVNI